MVAIKDSVRPVAERANFGAAAPDSVPKFGENVVAFGQQTGRGDASIEARFWEVTVEHVLRVSRTVGHAPDGRTSQPPKRYRVSFAVPGIRGLSACPLVRLPMPMVLSTRTINR